MHKQSEWTARKVIGSQYPKALGSEQNRKRHMPAHEFNRCGYVAHERSKSLAISRWNSVRNKLKFQFRQRFVSVFGFCIRPLPLASVEAETKREKCYRRLLHIWPIHVQVQTYNNLITLLIGSIPYENNCVKRTEREKVKNTPPPTTSKIIQRKSVSYVDWRTQLFWKCRWALVRACALQKNSNSNCVPNIQHYVPIQTA